jgi:hypothetical protein
LEPSKSRGSTAILTPTTPPSAGKTVAGTGFSTELSGLQLLFVRGACIAVFAYCLTVFVCDLPGYFRRLQTVCSGPDCTVWQLTSVTARSLQQIGLTTQKYALYSVVFAVISASIWFAIAAIIAWRRSNDGLALLVAMQLAATALAGQTNLDFSHFTSLLVATSSPWFGPTVVSYFLAVFLFLLMFLLFPTGHFVPKWMYWFLISGIVLTGIAGALFFARAAFSPWLPAIFVAGVAVIVIPGALGQLYRYLYVSTPVQRQQTKWIVLGILVGLVAAFAPYLPSLVSSAFDRPSMFYIVAKPLSLIFLLAGPLSWAIAIFRYHLWDIDTLINRTVVYGTLTGTLAVVYIGTTFLVQSFVVGITHQQSDVAIVIATLMIAILFQPLRGVIQEYIDRRFYRRKYDAAKALAAFNASLRDELDLEQLRAQLLAVIEETMQPAQLSLWLSASAAPRLQAATTFQDDKPGPPSPDSAELLGHSR